MFSASNSNHFSAKMTEYFDFKMKLTAVNGFYLVKWTPNNNLVKTLQTDLKCTINFRVHNSLENLHFLNDVQKTKK